MTSRQRNAVSTAGDDDDEESLLTNNKSEKHNSPQQQTSRRRRFFVGLALVTAATTLAITRFAMAQTLEVALIPERRTTQCVVRVNTFRRNDLLSKFLAHYDSCDAIAEITVVWSDQQYAPPAWLEAAATRRRIITIERHTVDSLNNRFKPLRTPRTEAVLSVDDDVFASCQTISAMVEAFRTAPRQMVGLAPRLVTQSDDGFAYLRWWSVWWNGAYSLVLTKVAVFHRDYLLEYSNDPALAAVRQHVHDHRNCEDIAMSFVVANRTKAPPVWLKAPYADYGQSVYGKAGISSGQDHIHIREHCIALFARAFPAFPLLTGHHKLVPAASEFFW